MFWHKEIITDLEGNKREELYKIETCKKCGQHFKSKNTYLIYVYETKLKPAWNYDHRIYLWTYNTNEPSDKLILCQNCKEKYLI